MEDESVMTSLIWRSDIRFADTFTDAAAMADTIPVAPREVAQIATYRATALLAALAKKDENATVVIRSASGDSRRKRGCTERKRRGCRREQTMAAGRFQTHRK
jgi:hypothetical protein